MATARQSSAGGFYPAYLFVDHDPMLDVIDTALETYFQRQAFIGKKTLKSVSEKSGVSYTTLKNWQLRKTKSPQSKCAMAVFRSIGAHVFVEIDGRRLEVKGERRGR